MGAITAIIGNIKDYVEVTYFHHIISTIILKWSNLPLSRLLCQQRMNDPEVSGGFRDIELELLCALANDIALHFEELESVVDKFELEEIKRKVGKSRM